MFNNYSLKQKRKRIIKSYFFIFFAAFVYTIGFHIFLQNAKIFSVGITAFASFWTFIFKFLEPYVSIIIIILNIPLLIFSYFKNNRQFTKRTIFFLTIQVLISLLFFITEIFEPLTNNILVKKNDLPNKKWAILILAIIGSILMGTGISISWMFGGSVGGTDIIVYYFSSKHKKDFGKIMWIFSFLILLFSFSITIIFNEEIRNRWLISLFSSFSYIFIVFVIVSNVYPKYKKVEVVVSSNKIDLINKMLKQNKYWHSWIIEEKISGYSEKKVREIKTTMFLLESKDFKSFIKKIDEKSFVSIKIIYKLFGNLSSKNIENNF